MRLDAFVDYLVMDIVVGPVSAAGDYPNARMPLEAFVNGMASSKLKWHENLNLGFSDSFVRTASMTR